MAPPRVRSSTTYTAMMKIIAIITTVGQPTVVSDPEEQRSNCKRGLDIDLNLRLGPWPDDEIGSVDGGGGGVTGCSGIVDVSDAPAESSVMSSSEKKPPSAVGEGLTADKSSQGECNPEDRTKMKKAGEVGREYSEITNIPAEQETEEGGKRRSEGYLDVLVEAVRQVSGFFSDEEEEEEEEEEEPRAAAAEGRRNKRGSDLDEECGPVVRSKRGRNQALPSRYRDSVLEPWGKLPTVTRCSKAARR